MDNGIRIGLTQRKVLHAEWNDGKLKLEFTCEIRSGGQGKGQRQNPRHLLPYFQVKAKAMTLCHCFIAHIKIKYATIIV